MPKTRKDFLKETGFLAAGMVTGGFGARTFTSSAYSGKTAILPGSESSADLVIIGGGTGGCAAALSALKLGLSVIMTEPTDWIGGQLTSQAVPPDENPWVEDFGASRSYQQYRRDVRDYYRRNYPLIDSLKNEEFLNPGDGWVSRIAHEPQVSVAVLEAMLAKWISSRQLRILREHVPVTAETVGDHFRSITVQNANTGSHLLLTAPWFIDATEKGDLLKLGNVEYVLGAEGRDETGEPHAPEQADPGNVQAFNLCFLLEYIDGENYTIEQPQQYDFWRNYTPNISPPWPGPLFSLTYTHPMTLEPRTLPFDPLDQDGWWAYRQVLNHNNFEPGFYRGPIACINWPQHAYLEGKLVDEPEDVVQHHLNQAVQLNLSLIYWLQTEAPRPDGGYGWPGLRLRGDIFNTKHGMAKHAYIRESRRIKAKFTVLEQHVGTEARMEETGLGREEVRAYEFEDSIGIGAYRIDLHPSTKGNNYIDISSLPFQIPLGSLIPQRVRNMIPACKNIGTTHITNGCYRLQPVEWNIGESAGAFIAFCKNNKLEPHQVYEQSSRVREFQSILTDLGVRLSWPQEKVHAL
ncbi:MAG: FAD-dependent oxidoreductase [Balneolaceae bacterium]|nr:MAG: FAD-dependent oxidoreductase [Balneolaceae bacterium]